MAFLILIKKGIDNPVFICIIDIAFCLAMLNSEFIFIKILKKRGHL